MVSLVPICPIALFFVRVVLQRFLLAVLLLLPCCWTSLWGLLPGRKNGAGDGHRPLGAADRPRRQGCWTGCKRSRAEGDISIVTPKPGPRCVALRVLADTAVDVTGERSIASAIAFGGADRRAQRASVWPRLLPVTGGIPPHKVRAAGSARALLEGDRTRSFRPEPVGLSAE